MIIVINGPVNSGKTTVGKELNSLLNNSVFFDADFILERNDSLNSKFEDWISSVINRMIQLGDEFIKKNNNIVFSYPLRDSDYKKLKSHFKNKLLCITLSPSIDECLKNRGNRELKDWEKKRISEMYDEGYQDRSFSDIILDNSDKTPQQSALFLKKKIESF